MERFGLVGLPNAGKSSLYNALTGGGALAAPYPFATKDPNIGVARVPDDRVERLGAMSKTKTLVHASVEVVDIGGLVEGASKGEGLGNKFLANIREVDAIVFVLRAFEDEDVTGPSDPIEHLRVVEIELPPLRTRLGDIPELVAHLAARLRPRNPPHFAADALEALAKHAWPGNIRELANIVERLAIVAGDEVAGELVPHVLRVSAPSVMQPGAPTPAFVDDGRGLTDRLDDHERGLISGALTQANGNIAEAARMLKTDRGNLYRRMRRLGIRGGAE